MIAASCSNPFYTCPLQNSARLCHGERTRSALMPGAALFRHLSRCSVQRPAFHKKFQEGEWGGSGGKEESPFTKGFPSSPRCKNACNSASACLWSLGILSQNRPFYAQHALFCPQNGTLLQRHQTALLSLRATPEIAARIVLSSRSGALVLCLCFCPLLFLSWCSLSGAYTWQWGCTTAHRHKQSRSQSANGRIGGMSFVKDAASATPAAESRQGEDRTSPFRTAHRLHPRQTANGGKAETLFPKGFSPFPPPPIHLPKIFT